MDMWCFHERRTSEELRKLVGVEPTITTYRKTDFTDNIYRTVFIWVLMFSMNCLIVCSRLDFGGGGEYYLCTYSMHHISREFYRW